MGHTEGPEVYVILLDETHSDPVEEVWTDREIAVARAKELVSSYARHPEEWKEQEIPEWIYYSADESSSVRVIATRIKSPPL